MVHAYQKTLLWLDDLRNPYLDEEHKVPQGFDKILWALNYDQFIKLIDKFGMPDGISFDHDLADEHYTPEQYWHDYQLSKQYQDSQVYTEKTGMDCAHWLVNHCLDAQDPLPNWWVHSANPVGADNIRGLLGGV